MQAKTVTKKILLDQKNNNRVISTSYNCQSPSSMVMKKTKERFHVIFTSFRWLRRADWMYIYHITLISSYTFTGVS